jgi:signal transduction histidine kinase
VIFTVSLAVWWLIHGLAQIERLGQLSPGISEQLVREQRMVQWEGMTLIACLIGGGMALLYYNRREHGRNNQVKEFFATLTHELKTPLASLRVQVESLHEDLAGTDHAKLTTRLLSDAARLELQLENALYLASARDADQLHLENLNVGSVVLNMKEHWPEIESQVPANTFVLADSRALEGILKNLVQNARVHGHATKIFVGAAIADGIVTLSVRDNGHGFKGNPKKLGELFARHTTMSGSGVGIYLARQLTEKMKGRLDFIPDDPQGFTAVVALKGGRA